MMADQFKTGDIVQLKSGGPRMTVDKRDEHREHEIYHCKWFAGAKLENGFFRAEALEHVTAEKK
jgi:uncharacterized protein YodC (DUF2158 family)